VTLKTEGMSQVTVRLLPLKRDSSVAETSAPGLVRDNFLRKLVGCNQHTYWGSPSQSYGKFSVRAAKIVGPLNGLACNPKQTVLNSMTLLRARDC